VDVARRFADNRFVEIDVNKAKAQFDELLERVTAGEEIVIVKDGKLVAKLLSISTESRFLKLGSAKGEFTVPDDFNDPLPKEIEDLFNE
jgi:prevent-host-death family protein